MSFVCASLMCHAPIVVPAVAGPRAEACASSTRGMRAIARDMVAHDPDALVVLSPHTPRLASAFSVCADDVVRGDLSRFGAPEARVELPSAAAWLAPLVDDGVLVPARAGNLDHGAMVPLWFLWDAGWRGPTAVIGFPAEPTADARAALGAALARAAERKRWALLASGDMSHRLAEGAPAGFDPRAQAFDDWVREHVATDDLEGAALVDPALRALAAEDVIDSLDIARHALGPRRAHRALHSYEGPFGVGYLNAMLHAERADAAAHDAQLLDLAEGAVEAFARREPLSFGRVDEDDTVVGVFVTLRSPRDDDDGALRGCVGRLERDPMVSLAETVADLAVSAAARDPRFPPVTEDELPLQVELSLLGPSETCGLDEVDPKKHGVSVHAHGRSGVLLPEVVDDAEQQVAIALQKAGIPAGADFELRRFRARKVKRRA